ncbi:MAG: hypothetical protein Q8Q12_11120 [bacterium]|nr:hypothetical protein [bacterium]
MRSTLPMAILAFAVSLSHAACAGTWCVNGSASEFGDGTSPDKPLETIQDPLKIRASRG